MTIEQTAIKATYISIASNTALAIIKGTAGYFGNSYALIADAIESTSDIFSSLIVFFGLTYASKPADESHPYGHGRAEPLITFLVVAFLMISAGIIAVQSIENIKTPHEMPAPYTLIILFGIISVKESLYRIVSKKGKETKSSALEADAWHHRSDAITSVTAFIGIVIALIMGKGYEMADDWAALVASGVILYNSYLIFRPALGEIMDENLHDEMIENIRKISLEVTGIIETEKCYIRKSGMKYFADLHAVVDSGITVKEGHKVAHILKDKLMKELPELANVLVHIEPNDE